MTLRSVRTLQAKLRKQEDASVDLARAVLLQLADQVRDLAVTPSRPVRDQPELLEVLRSGYGQILQEGVLLLRSTLEENLKAMSRDLKAIEANAGMRFDGLAKAAFDRIDGEEALRLYEEGMRSSLSAAWRLMVEQLERQRMLSERYDAAFDGLMDRWTSDKPVRRMGRKGIGVIPSWDSAVHAIWVNWMYSMVNAQRELIGKETDKILTAV